jgi:DNA modification methylase
MPVQIIQGDCRDVLVTMPDESVHCCVTSPPYWGLRDYGVDGQIGLEASIHEYVAQMVGVFREVRRVLRPDGTLWLNLGDSYAGSWGAQGRDGEMAARAIVSARQVEAHPKRSSQTGTIRDAGLKPKDLCGIPWRVAFALQADGWWLRSDIIWHKTNPMPESVTDRPTKSHEYIFLLSKGSKYFYDAEAIKEAAIEPIRAREAGNGESAVDRKTRGFDNCMGNTGNRNKRSVWTVATAPFPEAHFATFPPELIEPCIKAGTSEKGCCAKCGAPWERVIRKGDLVPINDRGRRDNVGKKFDDTGMSQATNRSRDGHKSGQSYENETVGWRPTCECDGPIVPCTVLDPFGGAGTTGLVADRLQRNAILIELNPTYAEMARRRICNDAPLFAEASL